MGDRSPFSMKSSADWISHESKTCELDNIQSVAKNFFQDQERMSMKHFDEEYKPKTIQNGLQKIVDICEERIFGQNKAIQDIITISSKITGNEFLCNQIVAFCNQIFIETLSSSNAIVNICTSFAQIDLSHAQNFANECDGDFVEMPDPSNDAQNYAKLKLALTSKRIKAKDLIPKFDRDIDKKACTSGEEQNLDHSSEEELEKSNRLSDSKFKVAKKVKKGLKISVKMYKCSVCEKKYKTKASFTRHERGHRKDKDDNAEKTPKTDGDANQSTSMLLCQVCGDTFCEKEAFNRHKALHKRKKVTKEERCSYCDEVFTSESKLFKHLRLHMDGKPFICEICGSRFSRKFDLRMHQITHSNKKEVACPHCDYKCYTNKILKQHLVVHSTERRYQCDECGRRFARSAGLNHHLRIHTGIKPFACDACPKSFYRKYQLHRHQLIHENELPYACEICGKRSRQAYNITVHMRTHTGHKPFSCEKCGKKFAHNVTLRQHRPTCVGLSQIAQ